MPIADAGQPAGRYHLARGISEVMLATVLPLALAWGFVAWRADFRPGPLAFTMDALALGLPVAAVACFARRRWQTWLMGVLAALCLPLATGIKLAYLGLPLRWADVDGAAALLAVLPGWRLLAALLALVLLVVAFALALRVRPGARWGWLLLPLALAGWIGLAWLAERWVPLASEDPVEAVREHGSVLALVRDVQIQRREGQRLPTPATVARDLGGSPGDRAPRPAVRPTRAVHLIVLESAWDPLVLPGFEFSEDPWDPRFRAAWEQGGRSAVMVPVFGGATANAEFAALCGLSAPAQRIAFTELLVRRVPCLPRVLADLGYRTIAHHPYDAGFWGRDKAYRLLGFQAYRSLDAFLRDDMDGLFLHDASTFRQVHEQMDSAGPAFHYTVSLSSHHPYETGAGRDPARIRVSPESGLPQRYASVLRYSTAAAMDHIEEVLARQPDALIVVFGDHAPALGLAPDPYAMAGIRLAHLGQDAVTLSRTPLLVIDGQAGPRAQGEIPLRELPARILGHLGLPPALLPGARIELATGEPNTTQLFLGQLLVKTDAGWRACPPDDASCDPGRQAQLRRQRLTRDTIAGGQYGLLLLGEALPPAEDTLVMQADPCELPVAEFGPRQIKLGERFFVDGDGAVTVWMRLAGPVRGRPVLKVGEEVGTLTVAGGRASASFPKGAFVDVRGRHPVAVQCPDGSTTPVGHLQVGPVDAVVAAPPPPPCEVQVVDWGPRRVVRGAPFYALPDGRSAAWIRLAPGSTGFELRHEDRVLATDRAADTISVVIDSPLFEQLSQRGRLDLSLSCPGRPAEIVVIEAESPAAPATAPAAALP